MEDSQQQRNEARTLGTNEAAAPPAGWARDKERISVIVSTVTTDWTRETLAKKAHWHFIFSLFMPRDIQSIIPLPVPWKLENKKVNIFDQ